MSEVNARANEMTCQDPLRLNFACQILVEALLQLSNGTTEGEDSMRQDGIARLDCLQT